MQANSQESADLYTFTKKIFNRNFFGALLTSSLRKYSHRFVKILLIP